ncbi:MAG: hypothetical protein BM564_00585 [Bacteroidetes bacterium MedPE-SWsnd-G2]|nr:MAG: hypothetical protein BM564_00585 [Bacteroidetes bacterium MedPE-SWsnd-G2]
MQFKVIKNTVLLFVLVLISCGSKSKSETQDVLETTIEPIVPKEIIVGANRTEAYLPLLKGKKVGIVANQTSVIFKDHSNLNTHLVDSLLQLNVSVTKVFAPEHGFRGNADAGETVKDGIDTKTGLEVISLYGKNKKPNPSQLNGLDVIVFDIQDVGARFYTYISSMHYVMEACAEQHIPIIILDRPNPNGHYVDGPILEKAHTSFVGMHQIPIVHGMTIAEYAKMINGESWLANQLKCELTVIEVENYSRTMDYHLPIKPSPNLPNDMAINLYPSLCLFEGTNVSVGRGTTKQFQIYGSPFLDMSSYDFKFFPYPKPGAKHPKHEGILCYGEDLSESKKLNSINLEPLVTAYKNSMNKDDFFNSFFTKLSGTKTLQTQIEKGLSAKEIKATWQNGIVAFKTLRKPYLLYK